MEEHTYFSKPCIVIDSDQSQSIRKQVEELTRAMTNRMIYGIDLGRGESYTATQASARNSVDVERLRADILEASRLIALPAVSLMDSLMADYLRMKEPPAAIQGPGFIQAKTHRRSRINKKWKKRYGMKFTQMKFIPCSTFYQWPVTGRSFLVTPSS